MNVAEVGPGLISTSPASRRRRKMKLARLWSHEMNKVDDGRLRYEK